MVNSLNGEIILKVKLQIFTLAALQTNQFRNNEIIEVRIPL